MNTETGAEFSNQTQQTTAPPENLRLDLQSFNKQIVNEIPDQTQILSYETKLQATDMSKIDLSPKFDFLPLKICILGGSGKVRRNLERCLATKFKLKILKAEEEINNLLIKLKTGESKLTQRQQSLLDSLFKGGFRIYVFILSWKVGNYENIKI